MWDDGQLQHWATHSGSARPSGIDLPGATEGLLPSQHWRDQLYKEGETERPWSAGDNVQLATGQGDLQTNPLQMAIAYAAIANGGTVVTPARRAADRRRGRPGGAGNSIPARAATSRWTPNYREDILEGLHDAAQNGGGTSSTSSATSRSRSRARPGPRSGRPTKTSPGTECWLPIRIRVSSPS